MTFRSQSVWTPIPKTDTSVPLSATLSGVCSLPLICLTRATSTFLPWFREFANHNSFSTCGAGWTTPAIPGLTCLTDGNTSFKPTWAVETNYYMDLGFLPDNMQYFSVSGRLAWYGPKGTDTQPLPVLPGNGVYNTKVEFNSEPIRLTLDASLRHLRQCQPASQESVR